MKIESLYLPSIPEDSTTELDSANFLGDKYINITMGRSPRQAHGGGELPYKSPTSMMQNIDMAQFEAQLRTIDQTIIEIQSGQGPLGQFIATDEMYQKFLNTAAQIEQKMHAA